MRNLQISKESRKKDQRLYEQEERRKQQDQDEEMLGNEERARLDREVPKRNQMLRIEVQKKRRKRDS